MISNSKLSSWPSVWWQAWVWPAPALRPSPRKLRRRLPLLPPHLKQQHLLRLLPLWQRLLPPLLRLLRTKRILMAWALCGLRATWWPRAPC